MFHPSHLPTCRGRAHLRWPIGLLGVVVLATAVVADAPATNRAERLSAQALAEPSPASTEPAHSMTMPVLDLLVRGGWLMLPIALVSVVVMALGVERALALRRSRILPTPLATSLGEMAAGTRHRPIALRPGTGQDREPGARGSVPADPLSLRKLCARFPSSAARVAQAVLDKLGRPTSELERSVNEACQREADRLYTNVRTLNLASTITPLLGLLGTVWGMIQAFFATANMPIGSNKGQALAEGIYVALATTFAGLSVAIPAAVLAHLFESRILRLLRDVEQLLGGLLPQLEHGHGKLRIDQPHEGPAPMTTPRPAVRRDAKAS